MTLDDIAASGKEVLTPSQVAAVLGTTDQTIRVTARQRPELLGFPVVITGNRVRIPKRPFLAFMGYGEEDAS